MKKFLMVLLMMTLVLSVFSAKYLYLRNMEEGTAEFIKIDNFDKISFDGDNLIISVYDFSSYSKRTSDIEISLTTPMETQKIEKVQNMLMNGYPVKATESNDFFDVNQNLTVKRIKDIKYSKFLTDLYEFIDGSNNIFDVNGWIAKFAAAIPVNLN
jgi:uncharacterized protein YxeA